MEPHVYVMGAAEARARVDRVKSLVLHAREDLVALWRDRAWVSLGYETWDALCDAEFGVRMALPRDERRDAVAELRAEGMSTRAIGSALGVHKDTVRNDLASTGEKSPVEQPERVTSLDGRERPASRPAADPSTVGPEPAPSAHARVPAEPTTGDDPEVPPTPAPAEQPESAPESPPAPVAVDPPARKRAPLTDAFDYASSEVTKAIERVERLLADDRFPRNADQVATRNRSDLIRARDALDGVVNQLIRKEV